MRAISTANIAYGTQILCIFCALGLMMIWALGIEGSYGLYALLLGAIFVTATLCGRYLGQGKKPFS